MKEGGGELVLDCRNAYAIVMFVWPPTKELNCKFLKNKFKNQAKIKQIPSRSSSHGRVVNVATFCFIVFAQFVTHNSSSRRQTAAATAGRAKKQ